MKRRGDISIVSGSVGSGKTTFCNSVIEAIKDTAQGTWTITGILAPAVLAEDTKIGIDALDLTSGERRRLAQRLTDSSAGIRTQRWSMDRGTIDWCNQVLRKSTPCDLLVVDELGPLEFERDEGFREGLTALDSGQYRAALVVVRTELLHFAEERWPEAVVHTIRNREHAAVSAAELSKKVFLAGKG